MADVTIRNTTTYHLMLTEDEAEYIKGLVQNPACEDPTDKQELMRESIWLALDGAGIKS